MKPILSAPVHSLVHGFFSSPLGSPDDFISCHGQEQGTPHQSLQLKEDGVTINKKSLISTKKQQDRGKKNEWFGFGAKCVNLEQLASIENNV